LVSGYLRRWDVWNPLVGLPLPEPQNELVERFTVVAVVVTDRPKDRRAGGRTAIWFREPAGVLNDGLRRGCDATRAAASVKVFDLFQRVSRSSDPETLADNSEDVHESFSPQQIVELPFSHAVPTDQPAQRAHLVVAVVIHVHCRLGPKAGVSEAQELAHSEPFHFGIVGP
jgi:hypothetical protein